MVNSSAIGFGRMTGTSSHWKPIPTADSQSTHQADTRTRPLRHAKMKHSQQLFQSLSSESISACLCLSISYLTLQLGLSQMDRWHCTNIICLPQQFWLPHNGLF